MLLLLLLLKLRLSLHGEGVRSLRQDRQQVTSRFDEQPTLYARAAHARRRRTPKQPIVVVRRGIDRYNRDASSIPQRSET